MQKVKLGLGKPVVVAQARPGMQKWGYCQFPAVERLPDGTIHVTYNNADDSPTAYGTEGKHAISQDEGKTFTLLDKPPLTGGVLLPSGDMIRPKTLPSLDPATMELPEPTLLTPEFYGQRWIIYDQRVIPQKYSGFPIERLKKGAGEWQTEIKYVDVPHIARYIANGVFPHQMLWGMHLAPDGALWAIAYPFMLTDKGTAENQPVFLTSTDGGETFQWRSSIPYQPLPEHDQNADKRVGWGEPEIAFLPDGSIICLIRTENGIDPGFAPLYITRSTDNGHSWSKPAFYDQLGVWPRILCLENGVTLSCYGRPGLYLRASADPAGLVWDERVTVVPPGVPNTETCAYASLLALGPNKALMVYSDFQYPNADGVPVKTILAVPVTADLNG